MFPNADFYQWWYYSLKSPATSEYWAFCYFINICPTTPNLEGVYFLFSYINPKLGKVQIQYKVPISDFIYQGNNLQFSFDNGNYKF